LLLSSSFPEPIRNNASDFLWKKNHSQDTSHCGPKQHIAKQSAPDSALFGAMLLPESEAKQHNGESQKPRTQSGDESARGPSSQSGGESER
jgi:hypothetical protein